MRIAVLSDIHANRQALTAVAKDLEAQRIDETWCLGDVVGYGAHPAECMEWVEENARVIVKGNHDHAVASGDMAWFNPVAAKAARYHAQMLSPPHRSRLYAWPERESRRVDGFDVLLVHGSPDDPLHEYVRPHDASLGLRRWEGRADVILMGHTHVPFLARPYLNGHHAASGGTTAVVAAEQAPRPPAMQWQGAGFREVLNVPAGPDPGPLLLNPGSVGQPRDGDARASYLVLDFAARTSELRRVTYDVEAAAHAIMEAGLDPSLASRLLRGR